jgi:hypothetical protein
MSMSSPRASSVRRSSTSGEVTRPALDAGVAQRRVELAEDQGTAIGDAAADAMDAIGLAPELQVQFAREFLARLAVLTPDPRDEPVIEPEEHQSGG